MGEDHQDTLKALYWLALSYKENNNFDKALELILIA